MSETIGVEEARRLIAAGEAKPVDLRDDDDWREDRIPGAIHLGGENPDELDDLPEEVQLIVVGSEEHGAKLADQLRDQGRDVSYLEGGLDAWKKEDYPTQPSHDPAGDSVI